MHTRKWKKFKMSKYQYPTTVVIDGQQGGKNKGHLAIGRVKAADDLKRMLGRDISHMIVTDTKSEWVFMEPLAAQQPA